MKKLTLKDAIKNDPETVLVVIFGLLFIIWML